jgi:hypothetical protein
LGGELGIRERGKELEEVQEVQGGKELEEEGKGVKNSRG